MNVNETIKSCLDERVMTLSELSRKTGVSRQRISQLTKSSDAKFGTVNRIFKTLGYEIRIVDIYSDKTVARF